MTVAVVLLAAGVLHLPVGAHNIEVYRGGHPLVRAADPAYDTCSRQVSFIRSRRQRRIIAELVRCWDELDNYTNRPLAVTYEVGRERY
jgi:hypothetical protein